MGSNQYQIRGSSRQSVSVTGVDVEPPGLYEQVESGTVKSPGRARCGELWGSKCRVWVEPPDYGHNIHSVTATRELTARNPYTPIWLLERLAIDIDPWVRQAVARNLRTPIRIIKMLATDHNCMVRGGVGENHIVPRYTGTVSHR